MRGEISNAPQGSRLFLLQCLMWRGQNSRELSESRVVPRATAADERYIPVPLFLPTREAPRTSRGHSCRIKKKQKTNGCKLWAPLKTHWLLTTSEQGRTEHTGREDKNLTRCPFRMEIFKCKHCALAGLHWWWITAQVPSGLSHGISSHGHYSHLQCYGCLP